MSDHKKRPLVTTSEDNFSRCHCTTCKLEAENERLRAALRQVKEAVVEFNAHTESVAHECTCSMKLDLESWPADVLARGEEASR